MKNLNIKKISALLLSAVLLTGCGPLDKNTLTPSRKAVKSIACADNTSTDETFSTAQYQFAIDLFSHSLNTKPDDNIMVSSYSMSMILAMLANGASSETQDEIKKAIYGSMDLNDLNACFKSWRESQPNSRKCKLSNANGIWLDSSIEGVKEEFLARNKVFYDAKIYQKDLNSDIVEDINKFCKDETDGMIPHVMDSMDNNIVMAIINAVSFDAKWKDKYSEDNIFQSNFEGIYGEQCATMLFSEENTYIEQNGAVGFLKYYKDNYAFVGILPPDEMSVAEYVKTLTGESLRKMIQNRTEREIDVKIPKFKYDTSLDMKKILTDMGISKIFTEEADFSALTNSHLKIDDVLHKTYIELDETSTKTAAVSDVTVSAVNYEVYLNRPFLYMILDMESELPIFIGTVQNIS